MSEPKRTPEQDVVVALVASRLEGLAKEISILSLGPGGYLAAFLRPVIRHLIPSGMNQDAFSAALLEEVDAALAAERRDYGLPGDASLEELHRAWRLRVLEAGKATGEAPTPTEVPAADWSQKVTLSGAPADPSYDGPAPQPIDPATGMHHDYWVLSEEERRKGFVRPVRRSYRHVGAQPRYPLRDLTEEERERYAECGYAKYEAYPPDSPEGQRALVGKFWTASQLQSGCGGVTTMALSLAETYARSPDFYSGTYCAICRAHFPVGAGGEFIWEGTDERVGT